MKLLTLEDGSRWRHPDEAIDLAHKFRYGTPITQELLVAAGILEAYADLVIRPEFRRKPPMIRRAMRGAPPPGRAGEGR